MIQITKPDGLKKWEIITEFSKSVNLEVKIISRPGLNKNGEYKQIIFYGIGIIPYGDLKRKMFIKWFRVEKDL